MLERHSGSGAIAARRATGPGLALIALVGALLLAIYAISGPALAQEASPSPTAAATEEAAPGVLPDTARDTPAAAMPGTPNLLLVIAAIGSVAVMLLLLRPLGRRAEPETSLRDED